MQGSPSSSAYRMATAVALGTAVLLVWLSLGVGIIGKDGDPANGMYFGVIAVGVAGSLMTRFRPRGMALSLFAMAVAQGLIAGIAMAAGLGRPWSGPAEITLLNGFFVSAFVIAGLLYRRATENTHR